MRNKRNLESVGVGFPKGGIFDALKGEQRMNPLYVSLLTLLM
jgi:hypothetical protein